jgi:hypothetical protein
MLVLQIAGMDHQMFVMRVTVVVNNVMVELVINVLCVIVAFY